MNLCPGHADNHASPIICFKGRHANEMLPPAEIIILKLALTNQKP